jgi:type II secretory pathway pseudopilin PulG
LQAAAVIRLLVAIGLIGAIAYLASPREFRQLAGRVEAEARSATATVSHFAHRVPTASQRLHLERGSHALIHWAS